MNDYYIKKILKLSYKNIQKGEVPIASIIVKNNNILSYACNSVEREKNSCAHAEIKAIVKAGKKNKNWRLNDCVLYVNLFPCVMCMDAIVKARIKKVVYTTESKYLDEKDKEYLKYLIKKNKIEIKKVDDNNKTQVYLSDFFKKQRIKKKKKVIFDLKLK